MANSLFVFLTLAGNNVLVLKLETKPKEYCALDESPGK